MQIEGTVLTGPRFDAVDGRIVVEDGVIQAIEEAGSSVESTDIVLPAFVNAHTHLGDSIAKEAGRGLRLDELVAPPDGLKHQLLAASNRAEKIEAMQRSISFMEAGGTGAFLDFREGGVAGVKALLEATNGFDLEPVLYGRDELAVLDIADGFGASGVRDADFTTVRENVRQAEKPFGIHAGERDPDDVQPAIDLDPDHLVHVVHVEPDHLTQVADRDIPIVACPRSNLVTGVGLPDLEALLEYTTVALGTDNVMLNSPSMFREMEFAAKCCGLDAPTVLHMATVAGAGVAGLDGGTLEVGEPARLLVLDGDSDNLAGYQDPARAAVRRAGVADVERVHLPANS